MEFKFIQQNFLLIAMAVVSGGLLLFSFLRSPNTRHVVTSTQATLLINREDALVIDVRESNEYVDGHLPESRNVPYSQLETRIGDLVANKETPLILVCQTGGRSGDACKMLEKQGFTRAHNLGGGIAAWRTAGLPLKKGTKK